MTELGGFFGAGHGIDVAEGLVSDLVECLETRKRHIFLSRTISLVSKETLAELGQNMNLTRERVRQLEVEVVDEVTSLLRKSENVFLREATKELGSYVGVACPINELASIFPNVAPLSKKPESQTPLFLLWAAGPFLVSGNWLIRADAGNLEKRTKEAIELESTRGVIEAERVKALLDEFGFLPLFGRAWLDSRQDVRFVGDDLWCWRGGLTDKAELILLHNREPMEVDEISAQMNEPFNKKGLRDRLLSDSRFVRRGIKLIGLTEWGGEAYTSIVDQIQDFIDASGGAAEINDVVREIKSKFPEVKENTIRTFASAPMFIKLSSGQIRRRRPTDPRVVQRIELARDCFFNQGLPVLRVRLGKDQLRGSGFKVPEEFTGHLGLTLNGKIEFESDSGNISFYWGSQHPSMGSIKNFAEQFNAVEGDLLFFRIEGSKFSVHHVSANQLQNADPVQRLLLETGSESGQPDVLFAVANALGLTEPGHIVSLHEIRNRLTLKGDIHLIELLPPLESEETGIRELISQGEGKHLEFKSSLSTPISSVDDNPNKPSANRKELELSVVKTIAAFSNSSGGILLIGVSDDGRPTGLQADYKSHYLGRDGFELSLKKLIKDITGLSTSINCNISFEELDGNDVCCVDVAPGRKEVYVNKASEKDVFYVRNGNATLSLTNKEVVEYVREHWGVN